MAFLRSVGFRGCVALLSVAIGACSGENLNGPSTGELRIAFVSAPVASGGTLTLGLINAGREGYLVCPTAYRFQQEVDGRFAEPARPSSILSCPTRVFLAPGAAQTLAVRVPADVTAGRYRVVLEVGQIVGGDGVFSTDVRSPAFVVGAP